MDLMSKIGEIGEESHRERFIGVPTFKFRVLGGMVSDYLSKCLSATVPWTITGLSMAQVQEKCCKFK